MNYSKTVSIIGAGALGTALTIFLTKYKKAQVKLWDREPKVLTQIEASKKSPHLPQREIPGEIYLSSSLKETVQDSNLVILAIPSFGVREVAERLSGCEKLPPLCLVSKGMERDTYFLPAQVIEEVLKKKDILHLAWVGFAKNIEEKIPASITLASKNSSLLSEFKGIFETPWLRPAITNDLLGVELAGALKNVLAIGIGLALTAKGSGCSIREDLIVAGVKEMVSFGEVMGAKKQTFFGPVGWGDLKISSFPDSRNYQLGKSIYQKGAKATKKELEEKERVAEGYHTAFAAFQLAKLYKLNLPIIEEVYKVIYGEGNPRTSAKKILDLIVK